MRISWTAGARQGWWREKKKKRRRRTRGILQWPTSFFSLLYFFLSLSFLAAPLLPSPSLSLCQLYHEPACCLLLRGSQPGGAEWTGRYFVVKVIKRFSISNCQVSQMLHCRRSPASSEQGFGTRCFYGSGCNWSTACCVALSANSLPVLFQFVSVDRASVDSQGVCLCEYVCVCMCAQCPFVFPHELDFAACLDLWICMGRNTRTHTYTHVVYMRAYVAHLGFFQQLSVCLFHLFLLDRRLWVCMFEQLH